MDMPDLARWIAEGRSLEEIGRLTGRHASTVGYWVRKHGLEAPNRHRHAARGGLSRERLDALVRRDLTVRSIAAEVDRSVGTVRYWLRFHGLQTTTNARRRADAAEDPGQREVVTVCRRHGRARHIRRGDGRLQCAQCNVDAVTARRRKVKRLLVAEAGGCCVLCGYDRWAGALQFHHLDPSTKRFDLSLKGVARSLDTVREEAQKCVVLCANCHAEVEAGFAQLPGQYAIRG